MREAETAEEEQAIRDRELIELLSELRVLLPGATVLFAFLLTVPFSARFDIVSLHDRDTYFVAFVCSAGSMVLLMGPSAYHRLIGGHYDKRLMILTSSWLAIGGIVLLGAAMTAAVLLVTNVIYGPTLARTSATILAVLAVCSWIGLPLYRRIRRRRTVDPP